MLESFFRFLRIGRRGAASEPNFARFDRNAEISGGRMEATGFEGTAIDELVAICQDYWDYPLRPAERPTASSAELARAIMSELKSRTSEGTKRYNRYVAAVNELGRRGPEIRDIARGLLRHPEYEAREQAAFWLGELGARGELEEPISDVIDELGVLAHREVGEEVKERQAIDAAIRAIGRIGDTSGIGVLREVLFSTRWYHEDDTKWSAAEALGKLVGRDFMTEEDPVEAAREWLRTNGRSRGALPRT